MSEMVLVMKGDMLGQFAQHFAASDGHTEANHDDKVATTEEASPDVLDVIDNNPPWPQINV